MSYDDDDAALTQQQQEAPETEVAGVRRRLREASQRLAELSRDRRALEEVRAELAAETRQLRTQCDAAEQARKRLEAEARAQEQRADALASELEVLGCELPLLRQRHAELEELGVERCDEIAELQARLRHFNGEVRASGTALELLHEAFARMDDKLERRRAVWTPRTTTAAGLKRSPGER